MGAVRILPEALSNRIAAGEVVERPASVVKELVENALDAGAGRIRVEIDKGGRDRIQVSDDGNGMSGDDALLAIERYATSKIETDADLFAIRTLGFRGEALPSIAAVSRFRLETRERSAEFGTRVTLHGGKLKDVSQVGAPPGTLVSVRELFFNTPARRKFLKTVTTEMGHIVDTLSALALGRPDVGFWLVHNRREIKAWPPADPKTRVVDLLGSEFKHGLIRLRFSGEGMRLSGWTAAPWITRSHAKGIYLFVNGRAVRDRMVQHALFEGYAGKLVKGEFPVAVLFLEIDAEAVDVNVHPTKHEVRFARPGPVRNALVQAVSQAVGSADAPRWTRRAPDPGSAEPEAAFPTAEAGGVSESLPRYAPASPSSPSTADSKEMDRSARLSVASPPRQQEPLWERGWFAELRIIGQFHQSYILCESGAELILIDQHAAHERILYERFKTAVSGKPPEVQQLLVPETLALSHGQARALEKLIPSLCSTGLEIQAFGGDTFLVSALPAPLKDRPVGPLIREIAEQAQAVGVSNGLEKALDHCLIALACHGAIKANQPLTQAQIQALLAELDQCQEPGRCPHGRPTRIEWRLAALEKSFRRIV